MIAIIINIITIILDSKKKSIIFEIEWKNNGFLFTTPNNIYNSNYNEYNYNYNYNYDHNYNYIFV